VKYLKCFGSMMANDERCTREIKSVISMAKVTFNEKKILSPVNWT
jgi:hypothetical protein